MEAASRNARDTRPSRHSRVVGCRDPYSSSRVTTWGGGGGGGGRAGEFDWIQACIPPFSPLSQLPKKGTFGLMTMASVASPTSAWAWARVRHTAVLPEPAGPSRKTDQRTPKISRS